MEWKQRTLEFKLYVPAGLSNLSKKEDKHFTCINNWQDHKEEELSGLVLAYGYTVQYIGIKDINRKKVFEGDICEFTEFFHDEVKKRIGVIVYDTMPSSFQLYLNKFMSHILTKDRPWDIEERKMNLKILGNFFQNPELVEKYELSL